MTAPQHDAPRVPDRVVDTPTLACGLRQQPMQALCRAQTVPAGRNHTNGAGQSPTASSPVIARPQRGRSNPVVGFASSR
jgi:hypothetical protein